MSSRRKRRPVCHIMYIDDTSRLISIPLTLEYYSEPDCYRVGVHIPNGCSYYETIKSANLCWIELFHIVANALIPFQIWYGNDENAKYQYHDSLFKKIYSQN